MSRLSTSLGVAIAVFALTAGGATLVLSATPTVAEKNQAASDAASQSDFELARNIWEPLAKGGNAEAQYNLGSMYYFVNGVAVDFAKSFEFRLRAAEQGHAGAELDLGEMYANGEGVAKDATEAIFWFRKSAEHGDAVAQYELGRSYQEGSGVAVDKKKALVWYLKAASNGQGEAAYLAGRMLEAGDGVPQDAAKAHRLYGLAARHSSPRAQLALGKQYLRGRGVAVDKVKAHMWLSIATGALDDRVSIDNGDVGTEASAMEKQLEIDMSPLELTQSDYLLDRCLAEHELTKALAACGLE